MRSLPKLLLMIAICKVGTQGAQAIERPDFEEPYDDQMLYLHTLLDYSFELPWQREWERRQLADTAFRASAGSISSSNLLSDIELNLNVDLNDKWRFVGSMRREGLWQRPDRSDRWQLGFERSLFETSSVYVTVNPEFDKEFMDLAAGYTWYGENRNEYVRIGLLLEDINYESKNVLGGETETSPMSAQWLVRKRLGLNWTLFSQGTVGTGFERIYRDRELSPSMTRHQRRIHEAEVRITHAGEGQMTWSTWIDWYDFDESRDYVSPALNYDYRTRQINLGAELLRELSSGSMLRILAHYVDHDAEGFGDSAHDYERNDVALAGFYDFDLRGHRASIGYGFGQPDIVFESLELDASYRRNDYRDKVMLGWKYRFSENAIVHASLSLEPAAAGFGGGALRFQAFF